jgi:hypothetical protein
MKKIIFFIISFMLVSSLFAEMILVDTFIPNDNNVLKTELYEDTYLEANPYMIIYYRDGNKIIKILGKISS